MFKIMCFLAAGGIFSALTSGCASGPSSRESQAAAAKNEALGESQGAGGEPQWVAAPYSVYAESQYIAASGSGSNRKQAEQNALSALVAIFGQSIQAEWRMVSAYSEAVSQGVVQVSSENTAIQNAITISSEMDSLVGAEIREQWNDQTVYYALAVLERGKTRTLYTDMIDANQRIIADLIHLSERDRLSLDGYSRYQLAATIADVNRLYAQALTVVGGSTIDPAGLKKGDDYRLEAQGITRNIPIGIQVDNDRSERIKGAFAAVLAKQGFRSGGTNSRYVVQVKVSFAPVEYPNQQNKFVRYGMDANFLDTAENSVLFPFNISGREGHVTVSEAENRAVAAAEKKISADYPKLLTDYLGTLLPKK